MARPVLLAVLLGVAGVAGLPACGGKKASGPAVVAGAPAGKVTALVGAVTATRGSARRALAAGDAVAGDDVIETGADGRVTIVLDLAVGAGPTQAASAEIDVVSAPLWSYRPVDADPGSGTVLGTITEVGARTRLGGAVVSIADATARVNALRQGQVDYVSGLTPAQQYCWVARARVQKRILRGSHSHTMMATGIPNVTIAASQASVAARRNASAVPNARHDATRSPAAMSVTQPASVHASRSSHLRRRRASLLIRVLISANLTNQPRKRSLRLTARPRPLPVR